MRYLISFSCVFVMIACTQIALGKECMRAEAIQAEEEASSLANWENVYRSFTRFEHCDDGAISEGYSETVGRLLANDWGSLERLHSLMQHHENFERFVIRHIDETVPKENLDKIVSNAKQHCPSDSQLLCERLYRRVQSLYEQQIHGR